MGKATTAIAAAAAVSLLAACGSGSSSSSTVGASRSTASPSTASSSTARSNVAAWRAKVNAICSSTAARASQIHKPTSASAAAFSTYLTGVTDALNRQAASIKVITPPARSAVVQHHVVSDLETLVNALEGVNNKHLADGPWIEALRTATTNPAVVQAEQDYAARSRAAGLTACLKVRLGA
jgi:hypothetical protein